MNILSMDTSGPVAGAAVLKDGRIVHTLTMNHGLTHSQTIMPCIDDVLTQSGMTVQDIDCIATVAGPGSFTGIRIGVCAAKGLAHAYGLPCARINALEALAAGVYGWPGIIAPIIDARHDQVYSAAYRYQSGTRPQRVLADNAGSIADFLVSLPADEDILFTGDGIWPQRAYIESVLGDRAHFAPVHLRDIKPETCAYLAFVSQDEWMPAASLTPIYLRQPQAERQRKAKMQEERA